MLPRPHARAQRQLPICTALVCPIADQLLEYQANDERHHADLYESYLLRIGIIRPEDSQIADSLDMLLDTSLGQEAVFAGYNVVLEGEAVKLQQDTI